MSNTSSNDQRTLSTQLALLGACLFFGILLIRFPLGSSLWGDECITWWITSSSFTTTAKNVFEFQGQSPLYFWLIELIRDTFGSSELILRLPSVLLAGITGVLLLLLGVRLFGLPIASFALLTLAASNTFGKVAVSARPYSMALFGALLSTYVLYRLLQKPDWTKTLLYASSLALMFYGHYLFLLIILPHAILLTTKGSPLSSELRMKILFGGLLFLLLAAPGGVHLLDIHSRSGTYFFSKLPNLIDLLKALFPPRLTFALLTAFLAVICFVPCTVNKPSKDLSSGLPFVCCLWLTAPILFFCYSHLSGNSLYFERYYSWSIIGYSLLWGIALQSISAEKARGAIVVLFCLLLAFIPRQWILEDWKGAIEAVNKELKEVPDAPILLYTGLIELEQIDWLTDHKKAPYLSAPLAVYPLSHESTLIPSSFEGAKHKAYFNRTVRPLLSDTKTFFLISPRQRQFAQPSFDGGVPKYFIDYFEKSGFSRTPLIEKGMITAFRFEKRSREQAL